MDYAWGQAVEGEHAIELPETMDNWIDMSEGNLVKPTGSLLDTLLIVSSYPTAKEDSTVHRSYGTTLDISNESMFMIYTKLGHHVSSIRDHGALHLDVFPRRVNRNLALGLGNIVDQVPTNLGMYWKLVVRQLIELSHSKLALLVGSAGVATYVDYLKQNNIRHQIFGHRTKACNATGKRFITE
ncbi:hypothetical protein J4E90_000477 [Alternaria incomplexa]|uniref:uncharacterized protein n=1 Tax=Alternaria incomplexa TaxID=1187928 RepID=UPI00221F0049|nr:uncharacterized protein J4E90_000477 [Alternaria incomplexa]XP_051305153.1 uncharacterized protein J4E86_003102 [Alternaria arbusti]KAI4922049.1 hypothetical protein J4E90_000477 [Alternaria incomplexa]KAI4959380.1 hypothetical protein J4E86_003102 [Alternaria arbusti]